MERQTTDTTIGSLADALSITSDERIRKLVKGDNVKLYIPYEYSDEDSVMSLNLEEVRVALNPEGAFNIIKTNNPEYTKDKFVCMILSCPKEYLLRPFLQSKDNNIADISLDVEYLTFNISLDKVRINDILAKPRSSSILYYSITDNGIEQIDISH